MPRWLWFAPLFGLVALMALGLYRIGWRTQQLTETEVIEAYVARYLREAQAAGKEPRAHDCVAVPGSGPVWIVVRCGVGYDYHVDRFGRLIERRDSAPQI